MSDLRMRQQAARVSRSGAWLRQLTRALARASREIRSLYLGGTEGAFPRWVDCTCPVLNDKGGNFAPATVKKSGVAYSLLGTFRLTSNREGMRQVPSSFEAFLEIRERRHATIMERRPGMNPGRFKQRRNRAGGTIFVEPELLEGTLARGFEIYRTLDGPFQRALFMMFIVAEVHPFTDGNGRVARVMMNAELDASQRIIVPIVYRNNCIASSKALSDDGHATALVRTMDFGQKYTMRIPWNSFAAARYAMTRTNAFMRPAEAEEAGIRLQIPGDHLLEEASAKFSPS